MTAKLLLTTVLGLFAGSACTTGSTLDPAPTPAAASTVVGTAAGARPGAGPDEATKAKPPATAPGQNLAPPTSTTTPGQDTHFEESAGLRLLSYNIHAGKGRDGVVDLERLAELILSVEPDVVALQEVDRGVRRTGEIDEVAELARLTGLEPFFVEFLEYQGGSYGMAILTRLPIIETRKVDLPWDVEPRAAAVVTVETETGPVTIADVHFYKETAQRLDQARSLHEALDGIDHPIVWIGDFNSQRDDEVMTWLDQLFEVPFKKGDPKTFPSDVPLREIDFVIFTPDAFDITTHEAIYEAMISDHRPVFAVLRPRPTPTPG